MEIYNICKIYFNDFKNIKIQNNKAIVLVALAALSCIVAYTINFALKYKASLFHSLVSKEPHCLVDQKIIGSKEDIPNNIDPTTFQNPINNPATPSLRTENFSIEDLFMKVLETYGFGSAPTKNQKNLIEYSKSADYVRHAQTARIYYNSTQLGKKDALRVIFQREPTNIAMEEEQYNKDKLQALFDYTTGIYNDLDARKEDGSLFTTLPNTASVYSETYLWNPPGGGNKIEVACLSLPAPALDSEKQPHYTYYMETGALDETKYREEIEFLFKTIEKTVKDNLKTAFGNKGIKRLVLSKFGQNNFLEKLEPYDQKKCHSIYKEHLGTFLGKMGKLQDLDIVMSEYSDPFEEEKWCEKIIVGDIVLTAQERDLIVNPWDLNSAPGNGNDFDRSFDGAMGRSTGILLTQTSWLNLFLRSENALVAVE